MPELSGNGFPVLASDSPDLVLLDSVPIPVAAAAKDVFDTFVERYTAEVEPIQLGQSHGYSRRAIAGTDRWSNHASGTALDLNAIAHPQYAHTFDAEHLAALRGVLADFPQIQWGGDWSPAFLDQMHYEIRKDADMAMFITSKFGLRKVFGKTNMHRGLDYRSRHGDARPSLFDGVVIATRSGRVPGAPVGRADRNGTPALDRTLSGNGVKVRRAEGHIYVEAHMDPAVDVGDRIKRGDVLGRTDTSGTITAAHAHTELWTSDDPDTYYDPTSEVLAAAKAPIETKEWDEMVSKAELEDVVGKIVEAKIKEHTGDAVWRHNFGADTKFNVPAENAGERLRSVRIHLEAIFRPLRGGTAGTFADGWLTRAMIQLAQKSGIKVNR